MINIGRISAFQMGIIMYPTIQATAILLVPSITAKYADRDMWISPMWASLIGIVTVIIAWQLSKLHPNETLIEYSGTILGKALGKAIGLVYILFYFHDTGIVIREFGEYVVGTSLFRTPLFVVMGSMTLVCALNVRGGLEVMARSAQIFIPIVVVLFFAIIILLIPDLDPENMLPILEHGIGPSFRGSIVPQGWFSEFILVSFLIPYLSNKGKGLKWGIVSVLAVMLTMVVTNLASLFLLGNVTASLNYPVMIAARYISIADFFEHLESIVMAIWVAGTFVKISMFYYVVALGTGQWLNLSDYRPLVMPIGFLLVLSSFWSTTSLQELVRFFDTVSPFYSISVQMLLPLLLLVIATLQKKFVGKGAN
jgi:spore germination protein KB